MRLAIPLTMQIMQRMQRIHRMSRLRLMSSKNSCPVQSGAERTAMR